MFHVEHCSTTSAKAATVAPRVQGWQLLLGRLGSQELMRSGDKEPEFS